MKIEKKECAPTDMQRWLIYDTAMVFDGGVGRSFYVAPTRGADWQGAELFALDAVARPCTIWTLGWNTQMIAVMLAAVEGLWFVQTARAA